MIVIDMPPANSGQPTWSRCASMGDLTRRPGTFGRCLRARRGDHWRRHMESSGLPAGEEGSHSGLVRRS
jgi:hypothetical protein